MGNPSVGRRIKAEQSSVPVPEGRKDLATDELFQLHEISTLLIQEDNLDALYSRILDAAMSMMSSAVASIQLLGDRRLD
jgi:hypothetical protein